MFAKGSLGNLYAENQVGNICLFCKLMIDEVPTLYLCSLGSLGTLGGYGRNSNTLKILNHLFKWTVYRIKSANK